MDKVKIKYRFGRVGRGLAILVLRGFFDRLCALFEDVTDDRVKHLQKMFAQDERELVREFIDLARNLCGDKLRLRDDALLRRIEDLGLAAPRKDTN